MISKKLLILMEIAAGQPNVRQSDIAEKLSITVQAVSEYIKKLIEEGYVKSSGPLNYRVTPKGVEVLLKGGRTLRETSNMILDEIVSSKRVFAAIACCSISKGEKVDLWMEEGFLKAGRKAGVSAKGTAVEQAKTGEDVAITGLEGIIGLEKGKVRVLIVPSVEKGGSKNLDYRELKKAVKEGFVFALGIEAWVALKKISIRPDAFFGSIEAAAQACYHGVSPVVVAAEREVPELIKRLSEEGIIYSLSEVKLKPPD